MLSPRRHCPKRLRQGLVLRDPAAGQLGRVSLDGFARPGGRGHVGAGPGHEHRRRRVESARRRHAAQRRRGHAAGAVAVGEHQGRRRAGRREPPGGRAQGAEHHRFLRLTERWREAEPGGAQLVHLLRQNIIAV